MVKGIHFVTIATLGAAVLAAAPAAAQEAPSDGPVLDGIMDVQVKNDYVTPRGVVVTSKGAAVQTLALAALSLPNGLAFSGGVWVDFNPGYRKSGATRTVNETDAILGVSYKFTPQLTGSVTYSAFMGDNFPETSNNVEFAVAYADGPDRSFSVNPYAKLFWQVDGSSTTGFGKNGKTYDVEIGAVPTLKLNKVTVSAPTWFTVGPKSFFGPIEDGNLGVISTGLKIATPLDLGPQAGNWTIYATTQYYRLANDNLVDVKAALNNGDNDRDHLQFGVGLTAGF